MQRGGKKIKSRMEDKYQVSAIQNGTERVEKRKSNSNTAAHHCFFFGNNNKLP